MLLKHLFEETDKKLVVVYGGRFQPFHIGHFKAYEWLCDNFDEENVWLSTSNKTNKNKDSGDISPFNFKEKREIMISLYGLSKDRIIQSKNPAFSPSEVFDLYKNQNLVYVAAVGDKDRDRYKSSSFKEIQPDFKLEKLKTGS